MATAKNMSQTEIEELLEDRKNGMGLQKAARKYGIGIPRIRKIEVENGTQEMVPAQPFASQGQVSQEEFRKHFQEVQDSFAIAVEEIEKSRQNFQQYFALVVEEIQKNREDLAAIANALVQEEDAENMEDLLEEELEELEDVQEKMDWQIGSSVLFGIAGLGLAAVLLLRQKPARPVRYYTPPKHEEEAPKTSKIPEME